MDTLNLTQHKATKDQLAAGVVDLTDNRRMELSAFLTFHTPPSAEDIRKRAHAIAGIATQIAPRCYVMIGGAPFFMSALEKALTQWGHTPVYAFSRRESVEAAQSDGSVRKTNVFKHVGFVYPVDEA